MAVPMSATTVSLNRTYVELRQYLSGSIYRNQSPLNRTYVELRLS